MSEKQPASTSSSERVLSCRRCHLPLVKRRVGFNYLTFSFHTELLRCPQCGQVFVPEDLVKGRMAQVEAELEDK